MLKVGIDLDDVMWDFVSAWLRRYGEVSGDILVPNDIKSWEIAQYIKPGNESILFGVLDQNDFWDSIKPLENAQKYLEKLNNEHLVYVITDSNPQKSAKKFLKMNVLFPFIKPEQIITVHEKQMINVDVMVDDYPANLCDGRYHKVLFSRPHNKWFNDEDTEVHRVNNWEEVYATVNAISDYIDDATARYEEFLNDYWG